MLARTLQRQNKHDAGLHREAEADRCNRDTRSNHNRAKDSDNQSSCCGSGGNEVVNDPSRNTGYDKHSEHRPACGSCEEAVHKPLSKAAGLHSLRQGKQAEHNDGNHDIKVLLIPLCIEQLYLREGKHHKEHGNHSYNRCVRKDADPVRSDHQNNHNAHDAQEIIILKLKFFGDCGELLFNRFNLLCIQRFRLKIFWNGKIRQSGQYNCDGNAKQSPLDEGNALSAYLGRHFHNSQINRVRDGKCQAAGHCTNINAQHNAAAQAAGTRFGIPQRPDHCGNNGNCNHLRRTVGDKHGYDGRQQKNRSDQLFGITLGHSPEGPKDNGRNICIPEGSAEAKPRHHKEQRTGTGILT